jgi:hypothetical protein
MNLLSVIKLVVALAIALEIRPEDLAQIFASEDEVQAYFDKLVELTT